MVSVISSDSSLHIKHSAETFVTFLSLLLHSLNLVLILLSIAADSMSGTSFLTPSQGLFMKLSAPKRRTALTISHSHTDTSKHLYVFSSLFLIFFCSLFSLILAHGFFYLFVFHYCLAYFLWRKKVFSSLCRDFHRSEKKENWEILHVKKMFNKCLCTGRYFAIQSTHFHFVLSLVSSLFFGANVRRCDSGSSRTTELQLLSSFWSSRKKFRYICCVRLRSSGEWIIDFITLKHGSKHNENLRLIRSRFYIHSLARVIPESIFVNKSLFY